MPLTLTVINEVSARLGDKATQRWLERGGTVGRADNNDWTLPDPNMEISRCHARIRFQQGRYFLEDTSANGIMLADGVTRIDPAEPYPLDDGVEFLIGDYRIRATIGAQEPLLPETTPPPAPDVPLEGDAVDPLELLGGAVEKPAEAPAAPNQSYLNEHFAPPSYREEPAAPPPPAEPPATGTPSNGESAPLLPDDWWKSPADQPAQQPPVAAPPPPPTEPSPPPMSAPQAPAAAEPPPAPGPRPTPGGRGGYTGGEPETPAPPPFQAPAPGQSAVPDQASGGVPDQALRQMLAGAGLDPDQVPADKAEELGRILRVAIQGIMDLLRARMEVKNQFRMSVTLIQARENNPLKFSTSTEDALHNLMVKHNPDYLPAVEAFEASFEDLRAHQLAMLSGMRSGFFEVLRQFDPEHLEARFGEGGERSMLGRMTGPKHWDQYKALFEEFNRDSEGTFNRLFGEAFSEAYEKQMQSLKQGGK
ncbi:type VI secretion system FHA domain protein [Natronocella acetinitrilica]|uniref:Type VI secretion system FHA domain protein n=1 Tax=Natronocella acetinitrilica TaxID=414046 RepID=A0AAE3KA88_9GAMM|nr:type VI secretion system-associated FHA domain protein TagH [Natronocella acetinitrilica]MCP1673925.1 type VI secretion system FHA domain protein [Natronocella acetinitrilica]